MLPIQKYERRTTIANSALARASLDFLRYFRHWPGDGITAQVVAIHFIIVLSFILVTSRAFAANELESLSIKRGTRHIVSVQVEVADNPQSRRLGLMWRTSLATKNGMLFDFGEQRQIYMWMKNTQIPLDMLFITKDYEIVFIEYRAEPRSTKLLGSSIEVRYVLELNAGEANDFGISIGDKIHWRSSARRNGLQNLYP